jgi:hypothetical protein
MAATKMETTMNTRQPWIFGLAALGLALAAPVQAAPDLMDGPFMVARNNQGDEAGLDPRNVRKDERSTEAGKRRASRREAKRDEPQGYGYGYERRKQQQTEEDSHSRGRR